MESYRATVMSTNAPGEAPVSSAGIRNLSTLENGCGNGCGCCVWQFPPFPTVVERSTPPSVCTNAAASHRDPAAQAHDTDTDTNTLEPEEQTVQTYDNVAYLHGNHQEPTVPPAFTDGRPAQSYFFHDRSQYLLPSALVAPAVFPHGRLSGIVWRLPRQEMETISKRKASELDSKFQRQEMETNTKTKRAKKGLSVSRDLGSSHCAPLTSFTG